MSDGFRVAPEQLRRAATMIDHALDEGRDSTLNRISNGADYGHAGLARTLAEFTEASQLATDVMHADAESTGGGLRDAAGSYEGRDAESRALIVDIAKSMGLPTDG